MTRQPEEVRSAIRDTIMDVAAELEAPLPEVLERLGGDQPLPLDRFIDSICNASLEILRSCPTDYGPRMQSNLLTAAATGLVCGYLGGLYPGRLWVAPEEEESDA